MEVSQIMKGGYDTFMQVRLHSAPARCRSLFVQRQREHETQRTLAC